MQIAIDGPGGAGKSTIAKAVARQLGILYIDTGAMYRAVGLKAARLGLAPCDWEDIGTMLQDTEVDLKYLDDGQHVYLDGEDVSGLIRTPEISRWASDISAVPACRLKMVELQRRIASDRDVVMDGRDIGSYVLPEADVKIFLTADLEERARRRFHDLSASRGAQDLETIREELAWRDRQDSERELAPLMQTEDALVLDSTALSIDEVVARVLEAVRAHQQASRDDERVES